MSFEQDSPSLILVRGHLKGQSGQTLEEVKFTRGNRRTNIVEDTGITQWVYLSSNTTITLEEKSKMGAISSSTKNHHGSLKESGNKSRTLLLVIEIKASIDKTDFLAVEVHLELIIEPSFKCDLN